MVVYILWVLTNESKHISTIRASLFLSFFFVVCGYLIIQVIQICIKNFIKKSLK